jgi:vancomycin permeability regulator SanA
VDDSRWRRMLRPRRLVVLGLAGVAALALLIGGSMALVGAKADGHLYSVADVPPAPVAVVFGAKVRKDGTPSPYLAGRLDLALRLYRAGKVKAILVSGDHGRWTYDEPDAMRSYLMARDVPDSKVVADYAGFDTYQSCARARRIFGVRRAILVSQDFHIARAVALCRSVGIDATGVGDAQAHNNRYWHIYVRDKLADVKAVYDMTVRPDPKYLGRREHGLDAALAAH